MTRPTLSRGKRYTAQGLLALGAVTLGVWGVSLNFDRGALAQAQDPGSGSGGGEASVELDESTYFAVGRLRNELGLTSTDLRALECDTETAEAALSATLAWYETNQSSLHNARNNVLSAKRAIYKSHRADPRPTEAESEQLMEDLKTANEALATVMGQAVDAIGAELSADQRARWSAARENRGLNGALRYVPGLTDSQKSSAMAAQANGLGLASAVTQGGLTYEQTQVAEAVHAALRSPSTAVAEAEHNALPVPASLQQEREALANSPILE